MQYVLINANWEISLLKIKVVQNDGAHARAILQNRFTKLST